MKKDWELNRLKQLKADEERKAEEQDEDEMMYTYTKTEVSTTKNPHKTLKNLKKANSKLASWQRSLLTTPKTNRAERPKRTTIGAVAEKTTGQLATSKLIKKAVAIRSPVKKTVSTSNLIENELIKYRKQAEKLEIEAQRALKAMKAQQRKQRQPKVAEMEKTSDPDKMGNDKCKLNNNKILEF